MITVKRVLKVIVKIIASDSRFEFGAEKRH